MSKKIHMYKKACQNNSSKGTQSRKQGHSQNWKLTCALYRS